MESLELDDDSLDETMFCPKCQLPLYPKDENFKFFLFICRACSHEVLINSTTVSPGKHVQYVTQQFFPREAAARRKQKKYKAKSSKMTRASFPNSCKKILRGHFLYTSIPITEEFDDLKPSNIYIADIFRVKRDPEGLPVLHAVVLVGFGRKNKVNYFRFINSHGTKFCDKGFGNVRAAEIQKFILFEPL
ncbi:hypothetical protein ACP4OV_022504 [Aristida adscensionis]